MRANIEQIATIGKKSKIKKNSCLIAYVYCLFKTDILHHKINNKSELIVAKHFAELDSTNAEALRLLHSPNAIAKHGTFITTDFQISGRGQASNTWFASARDNYLGSMIYVPSALNVDQLFTITQASSLAVVAIIKTLTNEVASIKWPNDIYVNNKKVAGILIQNSLAGSKIQWSVVGIGLNVNETNFPEELQQKATSLKQVNKGVSIDLDLARQTVFATSLATLDSYLEQGNFEHLNRDYLSLLYRLDEKADYLNVKANKVFSGTIRGVSKEGLLLVEHSIGRLQKYDLKEIAFM